MMEWEELEELIQPMNGKVTSDGYVFSIRHDGNYGHVVPEIEEEIVEEVVEILPENKAVDVVSTQDDNDSGVVESVVTVFSAPVETLVKPVPVSPKGPPPGFKAIPQVQPVAQAVPVQQAAASGGVWNRSLVSKLRPDKVAIANKPVAPEQNIPHTPNGTGDSEPSENLKDDEDIKSHELGSKVKKWLYETSTGLNVSNYYIPHGFKNPGQNNCFINSVIQAMFACRPFVNLLKTLPVGDSESTPVHYCIRSLLNEFGTWDKDARKHMNRLFEEHGAGSQVRIDLNSKINKTKNNTGQVPLDPVSLKAVLKLASMDDGRQHDAQEFLSFLVNGLNDEYVKIMKEMDEREEQKRLDLLEEMENGGEDQFPTATGKWAEKSASLASKL